MKCLATESNLRCQDYQPNTLHLYHKGYPDAQGIGVAFIHMIRNTLQHDLFKSKAVIFSANK